MFPIAEDSNYGYKYSPFEFELNELKKNEKFMKNYQRGIELISLSYGWNIKEKKFIENRDKNQKYHMYDIRLRKIGQSLLLFEEKEYFNSLNEFVKQLTQSGYHFDTKSIKRYSHISKWPFNQ